MSEHGDNFCFYENPEIGFIRIYNCVLANNIAIHVVSIKYNYGMFSCLKLFPLIFTVLRINIFLLHSADYKGF